MSEPEELMIVGFIDESCKPVRDRRTGKVSGDGRHYVAAAAITLRGDLSHVRRQLRDVADSLGHPLHYGDLSALRRLDALKAVADVAGWEGHIFESAQPFRHGTSEHHVRAKLLERALANLHHGHGANLIMLEERGNARRGFEKLNQKDHDVLRKLQRHGRVESSLRIEHGDKQEEMLALADLLAGARTDLLCAVTDEPYALIAHRIERVHRISLR